MHSASAPRKHPVFLSACINTWYCTCTEARDLYIGLCHMMEIEIYGVSGAQYNIIHISTHNSNDTSTYNNDHDNTQDIKYNIISRYKSAAPLSIRLAISESHATSIASLRSTTSSSATSTSTTTTTTHILYIYLLYIYVYICVGDAPLYLTLLPDNSTCHSILVPPPSP